MVFKGSVEPVFEVNFYKDIEADKGNQVGEVPSIFGHVFHHFEQKDGDQG